MKKKIFIFVNAFEAGGAERVISLLLYNLNYQYDITLVLLNRLIDYDLPENQKIICFNESIIENGLITTLKLPFLAWKYKKLCKQHNVDVSLSFLKRPNYINCISRIMGNQVKIIISERSYLSEYLKSLPTLMRIITSNFTKWFYPFADLIISNSQLIKFDLRNNFNVKTKYKIINNPVNFSIIKELSTAETNLPETSSFTFINVGRFRKEKNHCLLIDAFDKIKHLNVKLVLLGKGPLEKTIKEKVIKMGLESQITFVGFDNNPFKYLSKSSCFVLSSNFEGFPNCLLEAMACSLPIISTDCLSGPREILSAESNHFTQVTDRIEIADYGILVPINNPSFLANAMELVINDKPLYEELKMKSKKRSHDFEVSKIMKQFREILSE